MYLRFLLLVILQNSVLSVSRERFICEKDFTCADIVCEEVRNCINGRIVPKSTYCNCCDKCVYEKDNSSTRCREEIQLRNEKKSTNSLISDDLWKPICDENGNYALKQDKKVKSICMTHKGEKLFGQTVFESSSNVTCSCSQYMHNLRNEQKNSYMIQPQERCSASGDFEKIQCIGKICYCANPATGAVEGRIVQMDHLKKLPCYSKTTSDSYLKPCEKELIKSRLLHYEFSLKGLEVLGLEKVQCDPDGTFSPRQCDTSRCSCTDKYGVQIRSYFTDKVKDSRQMTCNCARDNENDQYPALKCDVWGNFLIIQCFDDDRCFCVDEDGSIISKQLNITEADSVCDDLSRELKNLNKDQGPLYLKEIDLTASVLKMK